MLTFDFKLIRWRIQFTIIIFPDGKVIGSCTSNGRFFFSLQWISVSSRSKI